MSKKILIIDDSEPIVDSLILLFEEFAEKESFTLTRKVPIKSLGQAVSAIKEDSPDVILLDHNLGSDTGLEVLDKINIKGVEILSTSISVIISRELTETYRQKGVKHFPGKDFKNIRNCLHGNCGCYSPLISLSS